MFTNTLLTERFLQTPLQTLVTVLEDEIQEYILAYIFDEESTCVICINYTQRRNAQFNNDTVL